MKIIKIISRLMFLGILVLLNFALKTNITIMVGKRNKVNFFFSDEVIQMQNLLEVSQK